MAHSHNILLLSNKKTLITSTNNIDESQNLNRKSQIQKKDLLYESIYIKCKLIYKPKADQWYTSGAKEGMECKGQKESFGDDENVLYLDYGDDLWAYSTDKTH